MATFIMFGKYSLKALEGVSAQRTKKVENLIARYDGKVKTIYALLGEKDLILIVELRNVEDAIKVSTALTRLTGISFTTSPAVAVEDFDVFVGLDN